MVGRLGTVGDAGPRGGIVGDMSGTLPVGDWGAGTPLVPEEMTPGVVVVGDAPGPGGVPTPGPG